MLNYEFKKIMGKRKTTVVFILYILITIYTTYIMIDRATNMAYPIDHFQNFASCNRMNITAIILILIMLLSSFFTYEADNEMRDILVTSMFGKDKLAMTKIEVALTVANIMYIIHFLVFFFAYYMAYKMDFGIIIEGNTEVYTMNPYVKTQGNLLLRQEIGYYIIINFTVFLVLLLSVKLKKALFAAAIVLVLWVLCYIMPNTNIFVLDIIFSSMFEGLVARKIVYKEIFSIGNFHVTILFIEFIVYIILNMILFLKVKSAYKTR